MFCEPLDVPDEVISAQEAGELVIFVGAGVSNGGASNLPLFGGLTEQIGRILSKRIEPADRKDYDAVLGEWAELHHANVHEIAHSIIGDPKSQPNEAHKLLLQLFKRKEHVRIVTTNYDRHFSTAAEALHLSLPQYYAPALPMGDDFNGIVYLHGSVDDSPHRLVLTDADFGRAYLSQGWARTFLQSLYSKFHVLFVGYSHADILVTYLARGLPARDRSRRHALQMAGQNARWKPLGINVVPYPPAGSDDEHANLTIGLRRWAELSAYRPQDLRARIHQIVDAVERPTVMVGGEGTPSAIQLGRDADDILKRAFRAPASASWFLERARDLRWIHWLKATGLLPSLTVDLRTVENGTQREVAWRLIGWTVEQLITSHDPVTLALYVQLGGALGPSAWRCVIRSLIVEDMSSAVWTSPYLDHWLIALRHGCNPQIERTFIGSLVEKLASSKRSEHACGLFEQLLRVTLEWKEPWSLRGEALTYSSESKLVGELHEIRDAWISLQSLRNPAVDDRLYRMLLSCIEEIYATCGPSSDRLDPVFGARVVVDRPRGPHDPFDAETFVGDMLIDVIRAKAGRAGEMSESQILRWLAAVQPGWKRIAYFALRVDTSITAQRKAEIILENGLIYPSLWQLQHDPSELVAAVYDKLDGATKRRLCDAISVGPFITPREGQTPEEVAEAVQQLRRGFLHRLLLAHRGDAELVTTFGKLEIPIPDLRDEISLCEDEEEFGFVHDVERSPKSVQELLAASPSIQLDYFLTYKGDGADWRGPNRAGLLAAAIAAANENAEWARGLIYALVERGITTGDLWDRLVWGLTWHTKDPLFRRWLLMDVLRRVDSTGWTPEIWNGWTFHLFRLGNNEALQSLSPDEWKILLDWSIRAWEAARQASAVTLTETSGHDILQRAINHPVGRVVEYWVQYVSFRRRSDPESPYEWPEELRRPIAELVASDGDAQLLGLSIFGQFLSFVRYALPSWTREVIYALLDVDSQSRASIALWSSWLCFGRISAELAAELPPYLERSRRHLLAAEKETSNHFISYLAVIATSPFIPEDVTRWLRTCLVDASPAQRGWWNSEVARSMREQAGERQKAVWDSWAKDHLTAYKHGIWGAPTAEEFANFLLWPIVFAAVADEALELLKALPPQPVPRLDVLFDLERSRLAQTAPDFAARYLLWLLEVAVAEPYGYYGIDDVIEQLSVTPVNRGDLEELGNRLIGLGLTASGERLLAKVRAG
jgi:hypothetical protein